MKQTIVLCFARMSPPTIGHGLVVKKVLETTKKESADHIIILSKTQDKKKNPLPVDRKVFWAKKMFPGANIVAAGDKTRTFIEAAASFSGHYRKLIVVAGSDRVPEYRTLLTKYNGVAYNFDEIEVISAGERDPDADDASGMSATKMRNAAAANDQSTFKHGVPTNFKDSEIKLLMKEIRSGMGLLTEGISYKQLLTILSLTNG